VAKNQRRLVTPRPFNAAPVNIVPTQSVVKKNSHKRRPYGGNASMKTTMTIFATLVPVLAAAGCAQASSDDAWTQFQTDVSKACLESAKELIADGRTIVDPYGSEHFGLAVVTGKAVGATTEISTICVYDKQKKTAETGGEISAEQLSVAP
jgi:hypothetical protein